MTTYCSNTGSLAPSGDKQLGLLPKEPRTMREYLSPFAEVPLAQ